MAFNFIAMINLLNTARYSLSFLAQVEIGNTCKGDILSGEENY